MTTKELGDLGEGFALQFLRKKGLYVLETNYRFGRNEVDIICKDGNEMIFVEVKTRQTAEIGPPWKAVTRSKQKQIIKCANHYLITKNIDLESRFDIVSIVHNSYGTKIEHIDNAFYPRV
ncbi:MAG: YraN family protein [Fluviicola sp.]|nr:MAG: YraN family protein [Fluviicola sp.]